MTDRETTFVTGGGVETREGERTDHSALEDELKEHERSAERMRAELQGFVAHVQELVQQEDAPENEEEDDDDKSEDVQGTLERERKISVGMDEIKRLDQILAAKTRALKEKRKTLTQQEGGVTSQSSEVVAAVAQSQKAQTTMTTAHATVGGSHAKTGQAQQPSAGSTPLVVEREYFGLSDEQKRRIEELDRVLKRLESPQEAVGTEEAFVSEEYRKRVADLDSKLKEIEGSGHADAQGDDAQIKEVARLCRLAAEAKYAAEHPQGPVLPHPLTQVDVPPIEEYNDDTLLDSYDPSAEENQSGVTSSAATEPPVTVPGIPSSVAATAESMLPAIANNRPASQRRNSASTTSSVPELPPLSQDSRPGSSTTSNSPQRSKPSASVPSSARSTASRTVSSPTSVSRSALQSH